MSLSDTEPYGPADPAGLLFELLSSAMLEATVRLTDQLESGFLQRGLFYRTPAEQFPSLFRAPNFVLGAWSGDELVAYRTVRAALQAKSPLWRYHPNPDLPLERTVIFETCLVAAAWRQRGIATRLNRLAHEKARRDGHRHAFAAAHPDNSASVRVLKRSGFAPLVQTELYGGLPRRIFYRELDGRGDEPR